MTSHWIKLALSLVILAWASVFHASSSDKRTAASIEPSKVQSEEILVIHLPDAWKIEQDIMGNKILAKYEHHSEGQRSMKALLMISSQGLKTNARQTLKASASHRRTQICYHASFCDASEFKKIPTSTGQGLLATINTVEPAGLKTYLVLLVQSSKGDHWSAVLATDQADYQSAAKYFNEVVRSSIGFKQ